MKGNENIAITKREREKKRITRYIKYLIIYKIVTSDVFPDFLNL